MRTGTCWRVYTLAGCNARGPRPPTPRISAAPATHRAARRSRPGFAVRREPRRGAAARAHEPWRARTRPRAGPPGGRAAGGAWAAPRDPGAADSRRTALRADALPRRPGRLAAGEEGVRHHLR